MTGAIPVPLREGRRVVFLGLVAATSALGTAMMFDILGANGTTPLEGLIGVLFAVTFSWIAFAFWTAVAGFALRVLARDPLSLGRRRHRIDQRQPLVTRTAVVMPVYNEDTARVVAGFEAIHRDLLATGDAGHFDLYLLSDTTDPEILAAEAEAWSDLRRRQGAGGRLFYRRRPDNEGRKAGNIADFCRRWGAHYDFMIVLDADSLVSGHTLVTMVRAMQANPRAGMIQTLPIPVEQRTMFGRCLQFAAALYGPMLSTGLSFWQTDTANYWGHNAIVRTRAFMQHCGLPRLAGHPPLGGEILSHDFVEAALIRRGGWSVYLLPELEGSYEGVPGNALDFAKRDRRWAEGNLQHLRLLNADGLHPLSRLYLLMGALAYLSSLLWLVMLVASTVDAVWRAVRVDEFFPAAHQLFPDWRIDQPEKAMLLLGIVVGLLLLPKLMGVALCVFAPPRRRAFGGVGSLVLSALLELIFSVLIAPVMMTFHAVFVVSVLSGRRVTWSAQSRDGRYVPWREAGRRTAVASVCALAWGATLAAVSPFFFWVLAPVLTGLVLATPVISISSSPALGAWLHRRGIFLTPSETEPPAVVRRVQRLLDGHPDRPLAVALPQERLLPEMWGEMPVQRLHAATRAKRRLELARSGRG